MAGAARARGLPPTPPTLSPQVDPATASIVVALVDTTPPPSASSGVPLATAARAFASPAAVDEAPPPPTPWKLLTPPVVAFEFDLASPPACGAERVVEVAATAAGAATAVAAWVRLGHAGGSTWSSGLDDGAEREEGDGAGESVWGG